ncbi:MAG: glycosyltransferase [Paludibacter sp.]|nr:glycosyltransferase [Paludibacter sp.]
MVRGISVIVCCFNSEQRLPDTIKHLIQQEVVHSISWEIILINNNSTDNTVDIANQIRNQYDCTISFRIIDESQQGLSYARKKGVYAAQYQYIIFCDDDNWLAPNYVQQAFEIIDQNPRIGMLGGRGIPVSEIELPEWFEEKKIGYAVGTQSLHNGEVENDGLLWGAGVVLRTNIMLKIYDSNIQSLLIGRSGNQLSSGDDSELAVWHIILGFKLWYDDRLIFSHFISKERLTEQYVTNLFKGFEQSNRIMALYFRIIEYQKSVRQTGKLIILVKSLSKILLTKVHIVDFFPAFPRLKENIQLTFNSRIVFSENLALVQRTVVNRLKYLSQSI